MSLEEFLTAFCDETMTFTRADAQAALQHVVTVAFDGTDDGPPAKALDKAGCTMTHDLVGLAPADCDSCTCDKDDGMTSPLPAHLKNHIKAFQHCVMCRFDPDTALANEDCVSVTKTQFDTFHVSPAFIAVQQGLAAAAVSGSTARDPLTKFKKSIKCDPSLFKTLKEEKQWDTWQRSLHSAAQAQGVKAILDHNCMPPASADHALFQEKQKHMCSVF